MPPPTTPTKGAGDDVTKIINSLSAKWGLRFPLRDGSWSPMKVEGRIADDVFGRIKYLSFRNRKALDYALMHFEEQAVLKCSNWVPKPHAERDVTPRRTSTIGSSYNDLIKHQRIDERTAVDLMETLLPLVDQVAELVKRGKDYRIYDKDTISELPAPESNISPMKQSKLSHWILKEEDLSPKALRSMQPSSSDEFNPDADLSGILNNISMMDIPLPTTMINEVDKRGSEDEEFRTPPTTPPSMKFKTSITSEPHTNGNLLFQRPDPIDLPRPILARKRALEEPSKPLVPRKLSRGIQLDNASATYNSNHLSPLKAPAEVRAFQNIPLRVTEDAKQVPHFLRSYGSFTGATSFSTTAGSSFAISSQTTASTAKTTPNTSFCTDSAGTSFEYTDSDVFVTSFNGEEPKYVPSEATLKAEPNTPRTERLNLALQGLSTTSEAERSVLFEPMNADVEKTNPLLRSPKLASPYKAEKISHIAVDEYLEKYLIKLPLLSSFTNSEQPKISFRQLYEVTRISIFCKIPIDDFRSCVNQGFDDYDDLWSALSSVARAHGDAVMPERSSRTAWTKATNNYEGVSLTGNLQFSEKGKTPIFKSNLNPLRIERSHRLSREFGGDCFCVLGIPGIAHESLPGYLRPNPSTAIAVREGIIDWLANNDIKFLGKAWRAFYVKTEQPKKKVRRGNQSKFNQIRYRVFLYAGNGVGFPQFLNWFLPFKINEHQPCLKFFARLGLGVSSTISTIQFEPFEIIRTQDARADVPCIRRLFPKDQIDIDAQTASSESKAEVMNDGCARISKTAALAIAEMIGLDQTPCVFQGRIAGAKGLWMVDVLDESLPKSNRNWWIEITDSQLKFKPQIIDSYDPPARRVTFDVHSYSKKLSTAKINFQLVPILAHQGVPRQVFEHLLEKDLKTKVEALKGAMGDGLALRKWNQDTNPVVGERLLSNGIEMQGGLPKTRTEKINWFVEHGFEPNNCRYLNNLVYGAIKEYCLQLENKMNIELAKSTYALMLADPLGILAENEIHLGFSSAFKDPEDKWEEMMLHGLDVLVARLPASLPSDIQKVHAVFKPELRKYRDVIIFSSKGACSLASKLSGGDYDGDRAWVCWEPAIVEPFKNCSVPECPRDNLFGIERDTLKVSELIHEPDYIYKFLKHCFDFNMKFNMLGICTSYHESLCYSETSIDDPRAMAIAFLLGLLVDRAKAGIIFDESTWNAYKKKAELPLGLPKPAYRDKGNQRANLNNMIDYLVFKTAKNVREQALKDFSEQRTEVGTWDDDLVQLWKSESHLAKGDGQLEKIFSELKVGFEKIMSFWSFNTHDNMDDQTVRKTANAMTFRAVAEKCRHDFLKLMPTCPQEVPPSSILRRWQLEGESTLQGGGGQAYCWGLLKASAFYFFYHKQHSVAWYVAGTELGEIKAKARGLGSYRVVVEGIHRVMKVGKVPDAGRRVEGVVGEGAVDDEDDEYGPWDWDE